MDPWARELAECCNEGLIEHSGESWENLTARRHVDRRGPGHEVSEAVRTLMGAGKEVIHVMFLQRI